MEGKREGEKPRTKGKGGRRFAKRDKEKTRISPFFLPCPFQIAGYEHALYLDHKVGESGRRKKKIETCHETRLFPLSGAVCSALSLCPLHQDLEFAFNGSRL